VTIIVCYSRCWACQLGENEDHPGTPHTWMGSEDIEHSKDVAMPKTPEEWAALAESHPCNCWCVGRKSSEVIA
jgi:hypothetical protein